MFGDCLSGSNRYLKICYFIQNVVSEKDLLNNLKDALILKHVYLHPVLHFT